MLIKKEYEEEKGMRTHLFYAVFVAYNTIMFFYEDLPKIAIVSLSFLFITYILVKFSREFDFIQKLFLITIAFIPTSFISVLGTKYNVFPLSWFNLTTITLFLLIIFRGKIFLPYFISLFIFVAYSTYMLLNSISIQDSMKQILTITLFLFCFIIGEYMKKHSNIDFFKRVKSMYLLSVIAFSVTVLLQWYLVNYKNIIIGHYAAMGSNRQAYASIMGDFSFASLYIATGATLVLIDYLETDSVKVLNFFLVELFLIISMLTVNSRTGIIAFGAVTLTYLVKKIINGNPKALLIMLIFSIFIPIILRYILNSRGGQSILDGSGREESYILALKKFKEHIFLGVGFGLENLKIKTGLGVPHNLFIQYLLQLGVIGSSIFFSSFVVMFKRDNRKENEMRWLLYAPLIGSLAIPDIVSSRFLSAIIIIFMINSNVEKSEEGC